MSDTPLLSALHRYADSQPVRLHMPGHKGVDTLPLTAAWDVTELAATGDLYRDTTGPIQQAEALWAQAFHMSHALFLTGGSSQGIGAALAALTAPGDTIALDSCAHLAFSHAMALLDLHPVRLPRATTQVGLPAPLDPAQLAQLLKKTPRCRCVCVTSPTYYGTGSDLSALAQVCHAHGARLFVDAAHGAHFPFAQLGTPFAAADVFVVSAHKTLNALGQSALLFCHDDGLAQRLRAATQLFGTSSPSYLLMASLDNARHWQLQHSAAWQKLRARLDALRAAHPTAFPPLLPLDDPFRLVVHTLALGFTGREAAALWQQQLNLWPECCDDSFVVAITTAQDDPNNTAVVAQAIGLLEQQQRAPLTPRARPAQLPHRQLSPRQAFFAPTQQLALADADGCIAARDIGCYPPGTALVAAGERLDTPQLLQAGLSPDLTVTVCHE